MSRSYFSLLFPLLLLVSGFKVMPPQQTQTPEKAAQEAAESWLRLIDSGKYAESWDELAEVTKAKVPKDSWEMLRSSAGRPSDAEESKPRELTLAASLPSSMSVPGQASVILEYKRAYDQHRSTFEMVELMLEAGRGWRVAYYMKMSAVCLYDSSRDPNHKASRVEVSSIQAVPAPSVEPYFGRGPSFKKNPKGGTIVLVAKKDLPVTIEIVDETNGGIGSGTGGGIGIGSGDGPGYGPGHGYNTGGGNPALGGGDRNGVATAVDQRPVPLNAPQPHYTKEARDNKIQGIVIVRVLVGADGTVKQARITRGLPDGLDEQAIQAAFQLHFRPAMKGGQPVAFWQTISIEFNLK